MTHAALIRVLLIEDDEDDFLIARDLFRQIKAWRFELDWVRTYEAGLQAAVANHHDICLVDYRLGAETGVELLKAALADGCQSPIILLTGMGEHAVDVAAMRAGAADYLVKGELTSGGLERSIRYALERKRAAAQAAFEQARLAAFGATVGLALTRSDPLEVILEHCAQAMVQYLNGALAQIWTCDPERETLVSGAAVGLDLKAQGPPAEWPVVKLGLDELRKGHGLLIADLAAHAQATDLAWALQAGLTAYAAQPLVLENRLVGVMALYAPGPLPEATLQEMASVAHGIALMIERKHSERALDASEGKYRSVVESIREVVFQMDEAGQLTFLNSAWTAATGFAVTESLGNFFMDYVHPEDCELHRRFFGELVKGTVDHCRYEARFLTRQGEGRWMEVYAQFTRDAKGNVAGISGSLNDITERKLAEVQIQKLAAFPRVNPNPVLEFAADGSIDYFNDAAQRLAAALDLLAVTDILPPNAGQIARDCLASGQDRLRLEVVVNKHTLTWSFFPVASSQVVHCYGTDVTEVVNLESQFRHAQKLESVGQLAAGVAHDFNNILTVIQGYSNMLLQQCGADGRVGGQLKIISEAAQRAAGLTRQLLTFSRKQLVQPRVLSLNTMLQGLGAMLGRLLGEDIALEIAPGDALPSIQADPGMMEQVIVNLAVNARDAMPKGGRLRIATRAVNVDAVQAKRHLDGRPGHCVCLEITDSGCGMNRETLDRIFEPFFTTKEVGKGTGLGLATVYGIVKQHQGWIEVASKVGVGTTFTVFLPAIEAPAETNGDTTFHERATFKGRETILLVEDEPELLEMVREILQSYDYTVVSAANGVEALKQWKQHEGRIDLVLTDLVMPEGMNGRELVTQLRQVRPDLKVIYTSGYSADMVDRGANQRDGLFLAKPYRPPALARIVRECLDASAN